MENSTLEKRDFRNYGGQSGKYFDQSFGFITAFEIASRFAFTASAFNLTFEGWKSSESFDDNEKPVTHLRRFFELSGDDFNKMKTNYSEVFDLLEQSALDFLDLSKRNFTLESFVLDATGKHIEIHARHKTKNRRVSEEINTGEDFDTALALHPELVQAYFMFVWTFGKSNDEFLESLESIT